MCWANLGKSSGNVTFNNYSLQKCQNSASLTNWACQAFEVWTKFLFSVMNYVAVIIKQYVIPVVGLQEITLLSSKRQVYLFTICTTLGGKWDNCVWNWDLCVLLKKRNMNIAPLFWDWEILMPYTGLKLDRKVHMGTGQNERNVFNLIFNSNVSSSGWCYPQEFQHIWTKIIRAFLCSSPRRYGITVKWVKDFKAPYPLHAVRMRTEIWVLVRLFLAIKIVFGAVAACSHVDLLSEFLNASFATWQVQEIDFQVSPSIAIFLTRILLLLVVIRFESKICDSIRCSVQIS